jgi:hypothetical protein
MHLGMLLGGRFGMVLGMKMMRMGEMRVMGRILVLFVFGVFHRLLMMMRGLLVMLGGVFVMIHGGVMLAHGRLLLAPHERDAKP